MFRTPTPPEPVVVRLSPFEQIRRAVTTAVHSVQVVVVVLDCVSALVVVGVVWGVLPWRSSVVAGAWLGVGMAAQAAWTQWRADVTNPGLHRVLAVTLLPAVAAAWRWPHQSLWVGGGVAVTGVAGWVAVWWRGRNRTPETAAVLPDIPDEVAKWRALVWDPNSRPVWDDVTERWRDRTDRDRGFFPGVLVDDDVTYHVDPDTGRTYAFTLHLAFTRSEHHADTTQQLAARIAHVYDTRTAGLSWDVPRNREAWLTVTHTWWLDKLDDDARADRDERQTRILTEYPWTGPRFDPETGVIDLAVTERGDVARVPLFVPGKGARFIWFAGSTGGGKTMALTGWLASACSAGVVVPHIIDMQSGGSLSEWRRHAGSFGVGIDGADRVLGRMEAIATERQEQLAEAEGVDLFPYPTAENPMHLLVVTEAVLMTQYGRLMTRFMHGLITWRKVLIGAAWETQPATVDHAFGDAGTTAREQLQVAGSIVLFAAGSETKERSVGQLEPGLDTSVIPEETAGACLIRSIYLPGATLCRTPRIDDKRALTQAAVIPPWEPSPRILDAEAAVTPAGVEPEMSLAFPPLPDLSGIASFPAARVKKTQRIAEAVQAAKTRGLTITTDELLKIAGCTQQTVSNAAAEYPQMTRIQKGVWTWAS